jgi:hypothetical protein
MRTRIRSVAAGLAAATVVAIAGACSRDDASDDAYCSTLRAATSERASAGSTLTEKTCRIRLPSS